MRLTKILQTISMKYFFKFIGKLDTNVIKTEKASKHFLQAFFIRGNNVIGKTRTINFQLILIAWPYLMKIRTGFEPITP